MTYIRGAPTHQVASPSAVVGRIARLGQNVASPYSMVVEWDPRDDIFIATVPELPGCRTFGRTRAEAVRQGEEAMELWIDDARAHGDPIPPPRDFVPRSANVRSTAAVGVGA